MQGNQNIVGTNPQTITTTTGNTTVTNTTTTNTPPNPIY